jgi:CheY-like chemotaxis protein
MEEKRVLVVDDTRLNRELVKDLLETEDYLVTEAECGREALDSVRTQRPHLVLLDIELPDMSGLDVLAALKQDPATQDIPVVALTAHNQPDELQRFLSAGFVACISKPLNLKMFTQTIAGFFGSGF